MNNNKIILFFLLIFILLLLIYKFTNIKNKKKLTIFCSSKAKNQIYINNTKEIVNKLDPNKITIVVGNRYKGLMGIISDTFIKNNGEVISSNVGMFINDKFKDDYVYDEIRDRQNKLIELGDEYLILPGAIGTTSELFEVLSKNDINEHHKNIYLYNLNGFYDDIVNYLTNLDKKDMIYSNYKNLKLYISDNIDDITNKINNS